MKARQLNGRNILLSVLATAALVSLAVGTREGLHRSVDFEWSGARLIAAHKDPWQISLSGDPGHDLILGQQPNYLPELYIIFLPFGLMSFADASVLWAATNILLAIASVLLAVKTFGLNNRWIAALAFLACTPLRVAIANGQQSLLVLFFLSLCLYCASKSWRGIWLGLSYSKYSFAPVLVLTWLLRRRYAVLLWSLIPPLVGLAAVYFLTGSRLLDLMLGPLRVARVATFRSEGYGDLMSLSEVVLRKLGHENGAWSYIPPIAAFALALAGAYWLSRSGVKETVQFAIAMVLTLLLFKHLIYDFVFLLFPFGAAIEAASSRARTTAIGIVLYFWFGSSLVSRLFVWPVIPVMGFNSLALAYLAGACALFVYNVEKPTEREAREADETIAAVGERKQIWRFAHQFRWVSGRPVQ